MSILVFEHEERCGPGRLGRVLVQYGHRLNIRRLWAKEGLPPDLDDVQAVVCLGAATSTAALLGSPWAKGEAGLIRQAHERALPVVGVGTGSLMVALALGGAVGPLADGATEVGWRESKMAFSGTVDAILSGQPWRAMQFVWQSEQVTRLADDSAGLTGTRACRTLAWRAGVRTYGFQQCIEMGAADIERWSIHRGKERQAAGVSHEQLMSETKKWMPDFDRLSERLCRCLVDYLLPASLRQCS